MNGLARILDWTQNPDPLKYSDKEAFQRPARKTEGPAVPIYTPRVGGQKIIAALKGLSSTDISPAEWASLNRSCGGQLTIGFGTVDLRRRPTAPVQARPKAKPLVVKKTTASKKSQPVVTKAAPSMKPPVEPSKYPVIVWPLAADFLEEEILTAAHRLQTAIDKFLGVKAQQQAVGFTDEYEVKMVPMTWDEQLPEAEPMSAETFESTSDDAPGEDTDLSVTEEPDMESELTLDEPANSDITDDQRIHFISRHGTQRRDPAAGNGQSRPSSETTH